MNRIVRLMYTLSFLNSTLQAVEIYDLCSKSQHESNRFTTTFKMYLFTFSHLLHNSYCTKNFHLSNPSHTSRQCLRITWELKYESYKWTYKNTYEWNVSIMWVTTTVDINLNKCDWMRVETDMCHLWKKLDCHATVLYNYDQVLYTA